MTGIFRVLIIGLVFLWGPSWADDPKDTTSVYAVETEKWKFKYRPLRQALHSKIVERRLQAGTSNPTPRLIFTAGPFGAGKSFVTSALEKTGVLDVSEFIWIDPDSIKEEIPEYEGFKKSHPNLASSLVHRESGHIQEELLETAFRKNKNIIVDGSLRAKDWWASEIARFRKQYPHYSISIISVGAPDAILIERVDSRGKVTGRRIPSELVLQSAREVESSVAHLAPLVDLTINIDNGVTPAIKSVRHRGKEVSTHFDLTGQLGPSGKKPKRVPLVSSSQLLRHSKTAEQVIVLAGYGHQLGYEDQSLLRAYVENVMATYGTDTFFILSHEDGVGLGYEWISNRLRGEGGVAVADESSIKELFAQAEFRTKIEVVSLRGENKDVALIKEALKLQISTTVVRDKDLDPDVESVAMQLAKNFRFDADPTVHFESVSSRTELKVVKGFQVPKVQRRYSDRTKKLRNLLRRIETATDQEIVEIALEAYPDLLLLTEGVVATPESAATDRSAKIERTQLSDELKWFIANDEQKYPQRIASVPQQINGSLAATLFGKAYPEFDRTVSALLLFKRLVSGDYEGFVDGQPEAVKLSRESFLEISGLIRRVTSNPRMRDAVIAFVVLNNIGKSEAVIRYLKESAGIAETNHQRVMSKVLKLYPFVSPTFQRLDDGQQQMVLASFETEFNLAQLAQGEAPPGALGEHARRTNEERDFYLATSLLKVSAAAGQARILGSLVMKAPVYAGFKTAISALSNMKSSETSIIQAYQGFLRARSLELMPDQKQELWVTRVCLMFRCGNANDGAELIAALKTLSTEDRAILSREFSATGFGQDSAILLYYGPAMLEALQPHVDRVHFFRRGLRLLADVMAATRRIAAERGLDHGVILFRMDSIVKLIRDTKGLPETFGIEIFDDESYGLSARLKVRPPGQSQGSTLKSCPELGSGRSIK